MLAEIEQVAVAGDDDVGARDDRAGDDVIVVGIAGNDARHR